MKTIKPKVHARVGEKLKDDLYTPDGFTLLAGSGMVVTPQMVLRLSEWVDVEDGPDADDGAIADPSADRYREIISHTEFESMVSRSVSRHMDEGFHQMMMRLADGNANTGISEINDMVANYVSGLPSGSAVPMLLYKLGGHSPYMYQHSIRCGIIGAYVALKADYPEEEVASFQMAMMLHDIGVLSVPKEVVNREGERSAEDWAALKQHSELGFKMLMNVAGIDPLSLIIARGHHVLADGHGYPDDIEIRDMPLLASMAPVVNDIEALTADRPYRRGLTLHEAVKRILARGDRYHPVALDNVVRAVGVYPVGTLLKFNTNEVGVVTANNPENLNQPEIMMIMDPWGKKYPMALNVDLTRDSSREIQDVLRFAPETGTTGEAQQNG